jgi:hypothetical protein
MLIQYGEVIVTGRAKRQGSAAIINVFIHASNVGARLGRIWRGCRGIALGAIGSRG